MNLQEVLEESNQAFSVHKASPHDYTSYVFQRDENTWIFINSLGSSIDVSEQYQRTKSDLLNMSLANEWDWKPAVSMLCYGPCHQETPHKYEFDNIYTCIICDNWQRK